MKQFNRLVHVSDALGMSGGGTQRFKWYCVNVMNIIVLSKAFDIHGHSIEIKIGKIKMISIKYFLHFNIVATERDRITLSHVWIKICMHVQPV